LGRTLGSLGSLRAHARTAELVAAIGAMVRSHSHVVRRRGGRAVGSSDTRVVLGSTPAEADTRVTNGVALHLVDGHLSSMAVDELDETAAFARRNLDISNLTEALEEGSEFVLGHVARKSANEDSGVVGVGELVHLSSRVECAATAIGRGEGTRPHVLLRNVVHH